MAARRSTGKVTTDHEEIRRWVEAKGACPARVKGTGRGSDPGILRIDFPGFSGVETLERIAWDRWFDAFDRNKLALIYQPNTRFSKLVSRETVEGKAGTRATPRRAAGAKRAMPKRPSTKSGAKKTAGRRPTSATTGRGTAKRATAKRATAKRPATRAKRPAARSTSTSSKRGAGKRTTTKRSTKSKSTGRAAR